MFAAVATIPLAEATAITFLDPIVAMVLAIPILGERVGRIRWTAAGIALAGAALLLRPAAGAIAPGALLALGGALFGAVPDAVGAAGTGLIVADAVLLAWWEGSLRRGVTSPLPSSPQPPLR